MSTGATDAKPNEAPCVVSRSVRRARIVMSTEAMSVNVNVGSEFAATRARAVGRIE